MTGAANFPVVPGAAWPGSRGIVAPVENISRSNGLHNDGGSGDRSGNAGTQRFAKKESSRFGTQSAPRWNGPRLTAPFVAQVLGQVLIPKTPDAAAAQAAYAGKPLFAEGSLVDASA